MSTTRALRRQPSQAGRRRRAGGCEDERCRSSADSRAEVVVHNEQVDVDGDLARGAALLPLLLREDFIPGTGGLATMDAERMSTSLLAPPCTSVSSLISSTRQGEQEVHGVGISDGDWLTGARLAPAPSPGSSPMEKGGPLGAPGLVWASRSIFLGLWRPARRPSRRHEQRCCLVGAGFGRAAWIVPPAVSPSSAWLPRLRSLACSLVLARHRRDRRLPAPWSSMGTSSSPKKKSP
jgi:hypothetical protein